MESHIDRPDSRQEGQPGAAPGGLHNSTDPPPIEPVTRPRAGHKSLGPLMVQPPPPGVEIRGFLRIMLNGGR